MYTPIALRALKVSYSDVDEGGVAVSCDKTQFFLNTLYKKHHFLFLLPFDPRASKTCRNTTKPLTPRGNGGGYRSDSRKMSFNLGKDLLSSFKFFQFIIVKYPYSRSSSGFQTEKRCKVIFFSVRFSFKITQPLLVGRFICIYFKVNLENSH